MLETTGPTARPVGGLDPAVGAKPRYTLVWAPWIALQLCNELAQRNRCPSGWTLGSWQAQGDSQEGKNKKAATEQVGREELVSATRQAEKEISSAIKGSVDDNIAESKRLLDSRLSDIDALSKTHEITAKQAVDRKIVEVNSTKLAVEELKRTELSSLKEVMEAKRKAFEENSRKGAGPDLIKASSAQYAEAIKAVKESEGELRELQQGMIEQARALWNTQSIGEYKQAVDDTTSSSAQLIASSQANVEASGIESNALSLLKADHKTLQGQLKSGAITSKQYKDASKALADTYRTHLEPASESLGDKVGDLGNRYDDLSAKANRSAKAQARALAAGASRDIGVAIEEESAAFQLAGRDPDSSFNAFRLNQAVIKNLREKGHKVSGFAKLVEDPDDLKFARGGTIMPTGSGSKDTRKLNIVTRDDETVHINTPEQEQAMGGIIIQQMTVVTDNPKEFVRGLSRLTREEPQDIRVESRHRRSL